jgi:hypothetical protein
LDVLVEHDVATKTPSSSGEARWDSVHLRAGIALLVIAVATTAALRYAVRGATGGGFGGWQAWQAGDWLINYSGGFVRRGLFGEIFRSVVPLGDHALVLLLAVQVLCYAVLFAYAAWYLMRERFAWPSIAVTCSPAALAFFGWDHQGGFRKEIIAFVTLVLLAVARRPVSRTWFITLGAFAAVVYVVAVLSWEGSAFMLPAVLFLLLGDRPEPGARTTARALAIVFSGIAIVGASLAVLKHGSPATAATICDSLRAGGLDGEYLCSGAIEAIGWTLEKNVEDVLLALPLYVKYIPLIALSALPIVASRWFSRNWRWALAVVLGMLPLFVIAIDWGRWVHILAVSMAVCIMASRPGDAYSPIWTPLATALYLLLWGIPHVSGDAAWPRLGFLATSIELADALLKHLSE